MRRVRGPEGSCSPVRLPLSRLLARWLACSASLLWLSRGGRGGVLGRGRGGEAPAFLRSGRNLSQRYWSPEEPSCSPGAPPGLSLPVRACWDGHGLGLELGAEQGSHPRLPTRWGCPGRGVARGVVVSGVRGSPPGVRGVPGSGSPLGSQDRPHGHPTWAPLQPILLVHFAFAARGWGWGLARDCKLPEGKVQEDWDRTGL